MGIERVVVLPFTAAFADLAPEEFLRDFISREKPVLIVVGEDFRFGRRGSGDGVLLKHFAESIGASAEIFPLVLVNGIKASSSNARERIERGDIKGAFEILGRYPNYVGTVTKGSGRGKQIGFPTVNIQPDPHMCLPMNGVYAGTARLPNGPKIAVIDVGVAPTFRDRTTPRIEAHILDFSGDLYRQDVRIEFREFLRREQRFSGPDELARQIKLDASQARDMVSLTDIERRNESKDGTD
jgi:riboflavin kinase/FMN adenylyltransferase